MRSEGATTEDRSLPDSGLPSVSARSYDAVRVRKLWDDLLTGRYVVIAATEHSGRRYLLMRRPRGDELPHAGLSRREREVAIHGARGASIKEIALNLELAPSTVCAHLGSALRKLGLRDRAELLSLHPEAQPCRRD